MKQAILSVLIALFFALAGCSNESPNAVELTVDFSWEGMVSCIRGGNPEIRINGIPADTMVLEVKSTVSTYTQGSQELTYDGSGIIKKGALDKIMSPCPLGSGERGLYKFKIKAVHENGSVIGSGVGEKYYPEEE